MEIMENGTFNSKTAEVKYLILGYMSEQEDSVTRNSIVQYVQEHVSCEVTDGVIAGAIKVLTSSGEIIPTERGIYVKGSGTRVKATSFEKIYNLCKRFGADLTKACTVNILELTEQEKKVYPDFIRILTELKNNVQLGVADLGSLVENVHELETGVDDSMENVIVEPVQNDSEALAEGCVSEGENFDTVVVETEGASPVEENKKEMPVDGSENQETGSDSEMSMEQSDSDTAGNENDTPEKSSDTDGQEKTGRKGKHRR